MAPLEGESFKIDAAAVHTILMSLIVGHEEAEVMLQNISNERNGRAEFNILRAHFERTGIFAKDKLKARNIIDNLYYNGENPPHMWFAQFEQDLTWAFSTYDMNEGRQVHSNEEKLAILLKKIKGDTLIATKSSIEVQLVTMPTLVTYETALAAFRNAINSMTKKQLTAGRSRRSYINAINAYGPGRGRGRGRGRQGRGRFNNSRTRTDTKTITLTDGQQIEYHPSFKFPDNIYAKFKPADKQMLHKEREAYRNNKRRKTVVQELQSQIDDLKSKIPDKMDTESLVQVSEVTNHLNTGESIHGGKNDRINKKRNNLPN